MFKVGDWVTIEGTLDGLETRVRETHNSKVYLANIEILKGLK